MAYNKTEKSDRPDAPMKRRPIRRRKKVCVFCAEKNAVIDYKDTNKLKRYISESTSWRIWYRSRCQSIYKRKRR